MPYMIIETGGKQYKAESGQTLDIEKIEGEAGSSVELSNVLLYASEDNVSIGQPYIDKAICKAEIIDQVRDKKIISFKYIRRNANAKTKIGHRQDKTRIKITELKVAQG